MEEKGKRSLRSSTLKSIVKSEPDVQLVGAGVCAECGRMLVRPYGCTVAICECQSTVEVSLEPVFLLPRKIERKIKVAERLGIDVAEWLYWLCADYLEEVETEMEA